MSIIPITASTPISLTHTAPASNGGPTGTQTTISGTSQNNKPGYIYASLPDTVNIGTGLIQIQNINANQYSPLSIRYYAVPTWTTVTAPGITTAGLSILTLQRDTTGAALPSSSLQVMISCSSVNDGGPTGTSRLVSSVQSDTITILDRGTNNKVFYYITKANIATDGNSISITTQAVPAGLACAYGDIYLSMNNGWYFHYTGLSVAIPTFTRINAVSLYPYKIGLSPWIYAQNQARISVATSYTSAVDIQTYYEESWRIPALPTGTLIDSIYFDKAINIHNATLIICAGTQYNATAVAITSKYPNVNVLLLSTLRQVLPARTNLAFASGRMYEAMFYAGFVAASVSITGKLGFIAALVHSGSYNFVNAFFLGARYAHANGFTTLSNSNPPTVTLWTIGAFSDDWAEKNAAQDLLTNSGIDILLPVTDNISPQLACHNSGCFSLGFNADERTELGDNVLISVIFNLAPIYAEFVRRMITGAAFGPDSYMGGLGAGVDITAMSSKVPLATQREVTRLAALSRLDDTLEEVFCGTLTDSNNVVRLNGVNGATSSNEPSVIGDQGKYCLSNKDINSMKWVLNGVTDKGKYNPPPKPVGPVPTAWEMPVSLEIGILVLPIVIFIIAILSSVLVIVYRKTDVIRYSSPLFLFIINIGACLFGAVLIKDAIYHPLTTTSCVANLWGSGIAFALLFGSLFAKTYRVHRLFNNKKLKRLRLNVYFVLRIIGLILIAEISVLLAIYFLFPREATLLTVSSISSSLIGGGGGGPISNTAGITYYACTGTRGVDGFTVLYALHLILLVWGAYLAYRTRDVPFAFNEAAFMGAAIYNVVVCEILAIVLSAVSIGTQSGAFMQHVVSIIRMGIPPVVTLLLLYAPKAYVVYKGLQDQAMIAKIDQAAIAGNKGSSPNNLSGRNGGSLKVNTPNSAIDNHDSNNSGTSSPRYVIEEKSFMNGFDFRAWWYRKHNSRNSTDTGKNTLQGVKPSTVQSSDETGSSENFTNNGTSIHISDKSNEKAPKHASNKIAPEPIKNNPPQFIVSPPIPFVPAKRDNQDHQPQKSHKNQQNNNHNNNNNQRSNTIQAPTNALPVTDIMSPEELENFMAGNNNNNGDNNNEVVTATEDAANWETIDAHTNKNGSVVSGTGIHNRLVGQSVIEKGIIGKGNPGTYISVTAPNGALLSIDNNDFDQRNVTINVSPHEEDDDGDEEDMEEEANGDSITNTIGNIGKQIFRTLTNDNRKTNGTIKRQDTGIPTQFIPPTATSSNVASTTLSDNNNNANVLPVVGAISTIQEDHSIDGSVTDDISSKSNSTGNPGSMVYHNPSISQVHTTVATSPNNTNP